MSGLFVCISDRTSSFVASEQCRIKEYLVHKKIEIVTEQVKHLGNNVRSWVYKLPQDQHDAFLEPKCQWQCFVSHRRSDPKNDSTVTSLRLCKSTTHSKSLSQTQKMEADRGEQKTDSMENVPLQAEARTEERDVRRKEFRDRFNRELAERKTWEEIYLGQLEERKTELKTAETKPPTPSEGQSVEQADVGQEVQEDDRSAQLFDELLEREIRQHKFLAEVAEIRIRQDKLFERFEEQRKKAEEEAFYRSRRRE